MGMYTEIVVGCKLKKDTPDQVIYILRYLCNLDTETEPKELPDHPFFKTKGWRSIAACGSYYFGVHNAHSRLVFDDIDKSFNLSIRANLTNYENEIEKFLYWLKPYISQGSGMRELFGYELYEEDSMPTLYFLEREGT